MTTVQDLYALTSIPTVSEKEADPAVTAIFEDIKQTLEVPFVNLIWRHLATIPGGLSSTWSLAKPLYSSQLLNEAARSLRGHTQLFQTLSPWPEAVLANLGITPQDKKEILFLLEDYGHANSRALLVLLYLHRSISVHLETESTPGLPLPNSPIQVDPLSRKTENRARLIKPARPLPAPADMSAQVALLVRTLNTFGTSRQGPAEPSLYRHLSYWPSFLAAFWLAVEPLERQGLLASETAALQEYAQGLVSQWKPAELNREALELQSIPQVLHSIDHFTHAVIGRMIMFGDMMKHMLHS